MLGSPTLTLKGRNLLAKIVAANRPLTLSNIGLGDGLQEENESVTTLVNEIMKKEIESCKYNENEGQYYVRRVFTNEELDEGFYIREVGIYAIDPDEGEILYAYTNGGENGVDYFAPGTGKVIIKEIIEMATRFGNAEEINITIDPSVALVTNKEFEEYKKTNKEDINNLQEQIDENTAQLNALANPSLLINGDFRNPVNQRRKSSYNVNGEYTIDRWRFINDNNGTMTINDGYISISNGVANNTYLQYNYDTDMKVLEGEKVTFTIVYKSTATYRLSSFIGSAEEDVNIYLTPIDDWTVKTLTLDLSSWKYSIGKVESSIILQSYDGSSFTNGTLDVKYIKLELGSVATPFIPRLYGEELALCQRYGEPIRELPQSIRNTLIQTSYMVEKRLTPTLKIKSMNGVDDKVSYWSGTTWIDLEILNKNWTNQSMCTIEFNKGSLSGDLFINFSAFADSEIY